MSRPEDSLPPDLYYNDTESAKYTTSSRIQNVQAAMTHRALQLLSLDSPSFILDLGCGSGLSGEILSSQNHMWIGLDIAPSMLDIALQRDGVDGDMFLSDIGQGVPFRAGTFDAAVSISAIQWLCNADTSSVSPEGRLRRFFDTLYASIKRGGKAVCQFYPKNEQQRNMITSAATRAGFRAGILEDDGGTKNAKVYLVLHVGGGDVTSAVMGMDNVVIEDSRGSTAAAIHDVRAKKNKRGKEIKGSKAWILKKKEQMQNKGKVVKSSSKYTGRKRGPNF